MAVTKLDRLAKRANRLADELKWAQRRLDVVEEDAGHTFDQVVVERVQRELAQAQEAFDQARHAYFDCLYTPDQNAGLQVLAQILANVIKRQVAN